MIITVDLPNGNNLSEGHTPLLYQGLEVGTLTKMTLGSDNRVTGELAIDPSITDLMRSGTRIEMETPQFSLNNPNVSNLLTGTTLNLIPGGGEPRQHFAIMDSNHRLLQEPGVKTFTLSAPESYGIDKRPAPDVVWR